MHKHSRLKNIFSLFKIAADDDISKFVSYMMSNSFSDFEVDEPEDTLGMGEAESLEDSFKKILENIEVREFRNIGPIVFWLLNSPMTEQARIGYVESLYVKLMTDSYDYTPFVNAIRYLTSGRYGGNGLEIFNTIITNGAVKDELDSLSQRGQDGSSYRLYSIKELIPYFVKKHSDWIMTALDKILTIENVGWEPTSELKTALNHVQVGGMESGLRQAVFDIVKAKLYEVVEKMEDPETYTYYGAEISLAIMNTFRAEADKDFYDRLSKIVAANDASELIKHNKELYIQEVKEAVVNKDLYGLYNRLRIGEFDFMQRWERGIVSSVIDFVIQEGVASLREDDDYGFEQIIDVFFDKDLDDKFPDLLEKIINFIAEKMPREFLEIGDWWNRPSKLKLSERRTEQTVNKALTELMKISTNDFINFWNAANSGNENRLSGTALEEVDPEVFNKIYLEAIMDDSTLNSMSLDSLTKLLGKEFKREEKDEERIFRIYNSILERADKTICESLIETMYYVEPENLKETMTRMFAKKMMDNIDEFYNCYLENSYKIDRHLESSVPKRIKAKVLQAVVDNKDSVAYFEHYYKNYDRGYQYAPLPEPFRYAVKRLEYISDIEEAKDIYVSATNDVDVEPLPDSKIKYSGYQTQQRPSALTDNDISRYELTQDNRDPTPIMYNINKRNISAADFMMHTNLGSSGFTSAWALISFPEDELLIEQIQSDYPVLLDRTFRRMPPSKRTYSSISYVSKDGARFDLQYKDDEGGVFIELKKEAADASDEVIEKLDADGKLDIMSSEEFNGYTEKAKEFEKIYGGWNETEENKQEAYEKASSIYRDRAMKIRALLDGLGLIPSTLYGLKEKYSEEDIGDVKKHVDIISQNYPYLIIINAIKTAQRMEKDSVYLLKSGGSSIQNQKKRRRIYSEMPERLGATEDKIMNDALEVWNIPATNESISKLKSMMPINKPGGYDYSLMPSQNRVIIGKRQEEERKRKRSEQEKREIKLSRDQIMPVLHMFEEHNILIPSEEVNNIDTAGDLLRLLGKYRDELKAAGVSKKRLRQVQSEVARLRLAEIIETFGLRKFGMEKVVSLYDLLINCELNKEADELSNMFENISNNKNLLLGRD